MNNVREVKEFILSNDKEADLEEIVNFLNNEFRLAIAETFNSLFILFKDYNKNKERIEEIICFLEKIIDSVSYDRMRYFVPAIRDFDNKMKRNLKSKQLKNCQENYRRIMRMLTTITEKKDSIDYTVNIKYLENLIFHEKNLKMIEEFLTNCDTIIEKEISKEDNIFLELLKKYLLLNPRNDEDIDYYYQVITLFLNSNQGEKILENKDTYFETIKRFKLYYQSHIIRLIELFDSKFKFELEELEERYNMKFELPNVIIKECERFNPDYQVRYDFTRQKCITIDGENAECLDDAIYLEKQKNGTYNLYIHITDIPSLIPYNSLTNEEARKRIETLYLYNKNVLMYPSLVSNYKCSLLPNERRNVISYIFELDPKLNLLENKFKVVKGTICSSRKMSYYEVDKMVKNNDTDELSVMLKKLSIFAEKRRMINPKKEQYRMFENFLYFETHHESLKVDYSPAANIIHESMILTNYSIAKYFKDLSLPYIYRKFSTPSEDFIKKQLEKIKTVESKASNNKKLIRNLRYSYSEAVYCDTPLRHKGLDLECYSHSTSPARRYADSYGQYLIYELIFNKKYSNLEVQTWEYRVQELVNYLNSRKKENEIFSSQYNYLSYRGLIKEKKK